MAIGVYFQPAGLTLEQFDEINRRLLQELPNLAQGPPRGGLHLSVFGEEGQLAVFNIWQSEEDWREFSSVLMPILAEVGLAEATPMVVPVHRLNQETAQLG